MTSRPDVRQLLVVCFVLFFSFTAFEQSVARNDGALKIRPEEYRQRRALLMAKMEPGSIAIFKAKDPANRSNDVNYLYRQESNFLYLSGCDEQRSYLLLCPEGIQIDSIGTVKEVLFIRPKTRSAAGESLGLEGAKTELGFAAVLPATELLPFARKMLAGKKILYYSPSMPDIMGDPLMEKRTIVSREVRTELQAAFPGLEIKSLTSAVAELRSVKSQTELELIQRRSMPRSPLTSRQ